MNIEANRWTKEETAAVLEYWRRGLTASTIAPLVGKTRSAVLGKIGRLGEQRDPQGRVEAPIKVCRKSWSEDNLTEKWADRQERLRRERSQRVA